MAPAQRSLVVSASRSRRRFKRRGSFAGGREAANISRMNEQLRRPDLKMTTQAAEGLMRRRWSVAEIEEMVKVGILADERFELIGGEVVPMSPKGIRHERVKGTLAKYWYQRLPPGIEMIQETTFRLDEDTFVEPDFVFFRASEGLANLKPETCLLAVEVADSSLLYDLHRKAHLYATFAVREVWVINAQTLLTHVHRRPGLDGYEEKPEVPANERLVPDFAPPLSVMLSGLDLI
jgi:Uma2 family endonuclease